MRLDLYLVPLVVIRSDQDLTKLFFGVCQNERHHDKSPGLKVFSRMNASPEEATPGTYKASTVTVMKATLPAANKRLESLPIFPGFEGKRRAHIRQTDPVVVGLH